MPISLHTDKIKDEKNAFVEELYKMLMDKNQLISGEKEVEATKIHKFYLTFYIMNYYRKNELKTSYYNYMVTSIIESESLVLCGFTNAAVMQLRSTLEMAIKFLYYENHEIEWQLHSEKEFDLKGIEYREFFYKHPKFSKINSVIRRDDIEKVWSELCEYSHFDINVINKVSIIQDMKTVFNATSEMTQFINKLKSCMRITIIILFIVDGSWLKEIEKSYFDYVFELLFSSSEARNLKINLGIE